MIFNPRRGGSEKEYKIATSSIVTASETKLKPGRVFTARRAYGSPKMSFRDPDTGEDIVISTDSNVSAFVMPCADVTLS